MATIRKITRRAPLSTFQNTAENGSSTLLALAGVAQEAYKMLEPVAIQKMELQADQDWSQTARRQIADPAGTTVSSKAPTFDAAGVSESASTAFGNLQSAWGRPLKVNSAYRDPEHNARVGGAKNSQHTHGNAFDVDVSDLSQQERIDLIKQARAAGFRGVGVYDNALHFDVGGDRAWGPSYGRESLPAWAAEAVGAPVGGNVTVSTQSEPEVMIRTKDGSLQPRLYSPASGPILQAYNAAAGIAYQSEKILEASTALMDLSNRFELDPDGFQQAAQSYIDQMVTDAPEMFRRDLRITMERQVQQRFLGILEDKQSDIRQRASNSNGALVQRYADEYADALAAGNPDAIAAAEAQLQAQLTVRESLPGLSWTPEQSYNEILRAQEKAETIRQQRQTAYQKDVDARLKTIIAAAESGLTGADEALLTDPNVAALSPDLFADAIAATSFRDALPSFTSAPPAERAAVIAELGGQPVTDPRDIKIVNAAKKADEAVTKAFADDPIAAASQYLPEKPPAIPGVEDPEGFSEGLAARLAYAEKLQAAGYTPDVALFSEEERAQFGAIFGKETPPEIKAIAARTVVEALGDDAGLFFQQVKSNDPVALMAGQLMARGGDPVVGMEAMRGQAMLDEGLVILPPKATGIAAISPDVATALSQVPGAAAAEGDVMSMAKAIYAARARGVDPNSEDAKVIMQEAVNAALGQTKDRNGKPVGGVQTIGGHPALLPPGMSGETLNGALRKAFTADLSFGQMMGYPFGAADVKPDVWQAAGALSAPMLEGQPLQMGDLDYVQLVPVGGNMYRLQLNINGMIVEPHPEGSDLLPFIFDATELIKAAQ